MISDREIWTCAIEQICQHGDDAAVQTAMRADELLERGDIDGARAWQLIVRRINQLEEQPSAQVH